MNGVEILLSDLKFGEDSEDLVLNILEERGYTVEKTSKTALTDFFITKGAKRFHAELKTRTCSRVKYEDTMIGANKLGEAWNLYYKEGIETLFLFKFTDGLYSYNPIKQYRTEYKAWRWDRWGIDKKKGWIYVNNKDLSEKF